MKTSVYSAFLFVMALLHGCASLPIGEIVPAKLASEAQVSDMGNIRVWGDVTPEPTQISDADAMSLRRKYAQRADRKGVVKSHILAVSGGADDGAFSAGLLVGWGARGDRPEFDLVTGVSAGALVAPFAFLGRSYDRQLSQIFVAHGDEEIYRTNVISGVFGGAAIADNAPLARLIARYVDRSMMARVAEERAKGRYLLISTTNLSAQRPVFWDMGRIAQVGTPEALELFRKVLLASAALPGIFPPVHIKVTAGGKTYDEVHVDGGPTRNVFLSPGEFHFRDLDRLSGYRVSRHLWIVRNGKVEPEYAVGSETALSVASRALETLTKNQGIGDIERMYRKAVADGIDFNLAYIPVDFTAPRPAPFDRAYMTALYQHAHKLGKSGYGWSKGPPGLTVAAGR